MDKTNKFNLLHKNLLFLFGFVISLIIFYTDYKILGSAITFTLLYLLPIVLVSWYSGFWYGVVLSVICITEWVFIQFIGGIEPRHRLIFVIDIFTKLAIYLFIIIILLRLKKSLDIEKMLSRKDFLTGVYNRQGFYEILDLELYRMNRNHWPLTIAYLDVDNFKTINDTLGHQTGDKLLIQMTEIIQKHIRKSDTLARVGGDEFILLMPESNIEQAKKSVDKLRLLIMEMMRLNNWQSSVSVGAGIFSQWDSSPEEIVHTVDRLMYEVKKDAKNNVVYKEFPEKQI